MHPLSLFKLNFCNFEQKIHVFYKWLHSNRDVQRPRVLLHEGAFLPLQITVVLEDSKVPMFDVAILQLRCSSCMMLSHVTHISMRPIIATAHCAKPTSTASTFEHRHPSHTVRSYSHSTCHGMLTCLCRVVRYATSTLPPTPTPSFFF